MSDPAVARLGLLTLLLSTAEWGLSTEPGVSLPDDPKQKRKWVGPRRGHDGKHVMSYSIGGIGLPHVDSGGLIRLFDYLSAQHPTLTPEADVFFKLEGINFDRIRAQGGHCSSDPFKAIITVDLDGQPFQHTKWGYSGKGYCKRFAGKSHTGPREWQIFRHWMRAALRQTDVQRWILEHWLKEIWLPSFAAVMNQQGGTVEEALVNARIRNQAQRLPNARWNKQRPRRALTNALRLNSWPTPRPSAAMTAVTSGAGTS